MTILFKDVETGKLKEEKVKKITPCVFHMSVIFEDGREEMLPIEKVYDISAE